MVKKILLVLISLLFTISCSGVTNKYDVGKNTTQPTISPAVTNSIEASVALWRGRSVFCSGERVDSSHILTAYHCAVVASLSMNDLISLFTRMEEGDEDPLEAFGSVPTEKILNHTVWFSSYDNFINADDGIPRNIGSFVKVDPKHDLALILTDYDDSVSTVKTTTRQLKIGEPVYGVGSPKGMAFSYVGGWISAINRTSEQLPKGTWLQIDMTVHGGMSGGGLYTSDGLLIGVVSFGTNDSLQSFFVRQEDISEFLE